MEPCVAIFHSFPGCVQPGDGEGAKSGENGGGETGGEARALAGGGRYDNLVKKMGGPDLPAVGFGMGDVTLRDLLELRKLLPAYADGPDFYAMILGDDGKKLSKRHGAVGVMQYRDDGPGWPEAVLRGERPGVGLHLIQASVCSPLRGELTLRNDGGAVADVAFRLALLQ